MRIYLIGFMGSGKTHTGRRLAEVRRSPFLDLDVEIETESGSTIAQIFDQEGEAGFRNREREALRRTSRLEAAVIACGGGTPCFFDNMDWINRHGLSIFLDAPVSVLMARLKEERSHRPLLRDLTDDQLNAFLTEKLIERRSFYEQAKVIYLQQSANEKVGDQLAKQFIHITGH